jgi:hypothetical protein
MSPADLATLSLLDPDQGVCPNGHRCVVAAAIGRRECLAGEYVGDALVCWNVTAAAINASERLGADSIVVAWARSYLRDQVPGN